MHVVVERIDTALERGEFARQNGGAASDSRNFTNARTT